uniref:Uncharacterized protein n=1 Tax=Anguilla anguilla TaxID=7936 RepID=A0A0E9TRX2_ANGAN
MQWSHFLLCLLTLLFKRTHMGLFYAN